MVGLKPLWHAHPHVRTGTDLTVGERAADRLKHAFGSWGFLLGMLAGIVVWIVWNKATPPGWHWDSTDLLLLNLCLSITAGLQGGALQIASNRGDRIASELAMHTFENGRELLELNRRQMDILTELQELRALVAADRPGKETP